jgi:hypothetical protein
LKGFNRPIPALEILSWRDRPEDIMVTAPVAAASQA